MGIILNSQQLDKISEQKKPGQTIVLTGGSFDILHAGHLEFLKRAGELGEELFILLESDEKIKKLKGNNRPVNSQIDRAAILSNLPMVSGVIALSGLKSDKDYEILVKTLQPDIIATSGSDQVFEWEKRLEKEGILKVIKVMDRSGNHSTTDLVKKLSNS